MAILDEDFPEMIVFIFLTAVLSWIFLVPCGHGHGLLNVPECSLFTERMTGKVNETKLSRGDF